MTPRPSQDSDEPTASVPEHASTMMARCPTNPSGAVLGCAIPRGCGESGQTALGVGNLG